MRSRLKALWHKSKKEEIYYADENDSPIKTKQETKKRIPLIKTRYLERFISDHKDRSLKKSL